MLLFHKKNIVNVFLQIVIIFNFFLKSIYIFTYGLYTIGKKNIFLLIHVHFLFVVISTTKASLKPVWINKYIVKEIK
jgi:hypothetical protein